MGLPTSLRAAALTAAFLAAPFAASAQGKLSPDLEARIDAIAASALAETGVPSASVAIVKDGRIALVRAYGSARLDPKTPADPRMRYSIGSISKQFTAAAVLLLAEEGKLSLDDKVARFLPDLTRADQVTIRQLLSHTSGYQDYWPQDYLPPLMKQPITAERIMALWAKKPLDYEPGSKWQYSNTGFVIAGAIVEKAAGTSLFTFLQQRFFKPLGMASVLNSDQNRLTESDATGYSRYALGPLRPSIKEGAGWMFAAGELAMTAEDLARWNQAVLGQKVLKPASWRELETEFRLTNGLGAHYGLGVSVSAQDGRRMLDHGGEVMGFTATNVVYPDDGAAVSVLTNQDAAGASAIIAGKVGKALFEAQDPDTERKLQRTRKLFEGLQHGELDRTQLTDDCNDYFDATARKDFQDSLGPLGAPRNFVQVAQRLRGGMTLRRYLLTFEKRKLVVWTYEMPDGRLEQLQVAPAE